MAVQERSFLETNVNISVEICSYLETRDIYRVGSCSRTLKPLTNSNRLWQMVSRTLMLPDSFWFKDPETLEKLPMRRQVQTNLQFVKAANDEFVRMCNKDNPPGSDGITLRAKIIKFAKIEDPNFDAKMDFGNPRASFIAHTRQTVTAMRDNCKPSCTPLQTMILSHRESAYELLRIFYACGEGGDKTLFTSLLTEYELKPSQQLAKLIHELILQGVKPPNLTLAHFLRYGPIECTRALIETTNIQVAPEDLSLFLQMFLLRHAQKALPKSIRETDVINLIDLMVRKQPERRDYTLWPNNMPSNDLFLGFGTLHMSKVIQKLLVLGFHPNNNDDFLTNTLSRALINQSPCAVIALLHKHGALPPKHVQNLIESNYDFDERNQLYDLLSPNSECACIIL